MRINHVLIERGKMGRDHTIINLDNLIIPGEEFPVYLTNENLDKDPIGIAKIYKKNECLWADIDLPSNKAYLKLHPAIAISIQLPDYNSHYRGNLRTINHAVLIGIILSEQRNSDNKVVALGKKAQLIN